MLRTLKGYCSRPIVLWVVFLLLLFFLISKPATGFSGSQPTGLIRSGLVKINGKTHHTVIIGERHFRLTESTTILDLNGKNIELGNLPIPCTAHIKYLLRMDHDPLLLKVVVKEVFPESSTVFLPLK